MSNESSNLHKTAAQDHEAVAKLHMKAAECHDKNNVSEAKTCAKGALDACNTAQKHSTTACASTAK